jgi:hypothetical protein
LNGAAVDENELPNANGAGVELYETDLNGAAVDENELPNANGAGVDEAKDLAPNGNPDEPDEMLSKAMSLFSFLVAGLTAANAVDTTRSPRRTT